MTATYLADTSAWYRSGRNEATREWWSDLLLRGALATCSPIRLELLYSARSASDYEALRDDLDSLPELDHGVVTARRAEDVQALLASRCQQRGPTPIDLYIAAIAEVNEATLVHYDRHFDAIADVTGQPAEWIAPRGTLD